MNRIKCDGPGCEREFDAPIAKEPGSALKFYCSIECACYDGAMSVTAKGKIDLARAREILAKWGLTDCFGLQDDIAAFAEEVRGKVREEAREEKTAFESCASHANVVWSSRCRYCEWEAERDALRRRLDEIGDGSIFDFKKIQDERDALRREVEHWKLDAGLRVAERDKEIARVRVLTEALDDVLDLWPDNEIMNALDDDQNSGRRKWPLMVTPTIRFIREKRSVLENKPG